MRQILYLDNTTIIELMPTRWAGILVVKATRLYVSIQALSESANNPDASIIRDTDTVYTIMERFERSEFTKFYRQYIADELVWYRGFAGSHFSYPEMRDGKLVSEGEDDIPTYTMQGKPDTSVLGMVSSFFSPPKKTRCLPGCFDVDTAITAGHQSSSLDPHTRQLMMRLDVPLTFVARSPAGRNADASICWFHSGEQAIRGPLYGGQFRICRVIWMKQGTPDYSTCDLAHHQIPPVRPFEPSAEQIDTWWRACSAWVDANWVVRRGLTFMKLDLSKIASASASTGSLNSI